MGGSSNKSSSSSRPLDGAERADIFNSGTSSIQGYLPSLNAPQYSGLNGGDYDAFQNAMIDGATEPLRRFETRERQRVNDDLSERGLWASGIATQAQNDVTEALAPSFAQAGAGAVADRYKLQMQDMQNNFQSQWAPLEYLAQLWNGTSGQVSNSKSSGWGLTLM